MSLSKRQGDPQGPSIIIPLKRPCMVSQQVQWKQARSALNEFKFMHYGDVEKELKRNGGAIPLPGMEGFHLRFDQVFKTFYVFEGSGTRRWPMCPCHGCTSVAGIASPCPSHHPVSYAMKPAEKKMGKVQDSMDLSTRYALFKNGAVTVTDLEYLWHAMMRHVRTEARADVPYLIGLMGFYKEELGVQVLRYKHHSMSLEVTKLDGTLKFITCANTGCNKIGVLSEANHKVCSKECKQKSEYKSVVGNALKNKAERDAVHKLATDVKKKVGAAREEDKFKVLFLATLKAGRGGIPFKIDMGGRSFDACLFSTLEGKVSFSYFGEESGHRIWICHRLECVGRAKCQNHSAAGLFCAKHANEKSNVEEIAGGIRYGCDEQPMVAECLARSTYTGKKLEKKKHK